MKVAVAVIVNKKREVLITQRPLTSPHGGCWEFPGGKLMSGEEADAALVREIKEEIGITVRGFSFLAQISHQYKERLVHLLVYKVMDYVGIPQCLEGQLAMRWASLPELRELKFPEANHKIMPLIQSMI